MWPECHHLPLIRAGEQRWRPPGLVLGFYSHGEGVMRRGENWTCIDMCSLRFLKDEEAEDPLAERRMAERDEI
jgi:hypothetical protein